MPMDKDFIHEDFLLLSILLYLKSYKTGPTYVYFYCKSFGCIFFDIFIACSIWLWKDLSSSKNTGKYLHKNV